MDVYIMDKNWLKENIECLEKMINNLEDYLSEQNNLIDKIRTEISDAEEDEHFLDELKKQYEKMLEKKEAKEFP